MPHTVDSRVRPTPTTFRWKVSKQCSFLLHLATTQGQQHILDMWSLTHHGITGPHLAGPHLSHVGSSDFRLFQILWFAAKGKCLSAYTAGLKAWLAQHAEEHSKRADGQKFGTDKKYVHSWVRQKGTNNSSEPTEVKKPYVESSASSQQLRSSLRPMWTPQQEMAMWCQMRWYG